MENNMYSHPEAFGLEIVGAVNDPWASWSYNMFVLWRAKDSGALYYGWDAGCSCPSPFEYFNLASDNLYRIDDSLDSWNTFITRLNRYRDTMISQDSWDIEPRAGSSDGENFSAVCAELVIKAMKLLEV